MIIKLLLIDEIHCFNVSLTVAITVKTKSGEAKRIVLSIIIENHMQPSESQKRDIISKIRKGSTFKNAPTSRALLQYLFEATETGNSLKEGVIELEFFGNTGGADRNNPRVRVNVYNLRKKLNEYYLSEGKDDTWQLTIDKGQYLVRFFRKKTSQQSIQKLSWSRIAPYIGMLAFGLVLVITNLPSKEPVIWQSFFSSSTSTNLIIGDHFGATGKTITDGVGWTRDFGVNTLTEFYELLENKPELKDVLTPANYTYTTRMAAISVQHLQQLFQQNKQQFVIRFSTQTSTSEIKEGNAVYVGPTKNNNQLIHFFNEGNPFCEITNDSLFIINHPNVKNSSLNLNSTNVTEEYAIVSKYPSTGETEHMVFFSQHDIGVGATVEYFTNHDSLINFTKTYLKSKRYFTAIFKVKGQNRTDTNLKLENVIAF